MSTKTKGIPLAVELEDPRSEALMEDKHADPKLRRALYAEGRKSRADALQKVAKFAGGRKTGADRKTARSVRNHVKTLRKAWPTLTAKQLRSKADKTIVGHLSNARWDNIVSKEAPRKTAPRSA